MIHGMPMDITKIPSYMTIAAAAERLGVDPATVGRWLRAGKLRAHLPVQAAGERMMVLLWEPDVVRFADARQVVLGGARDA